MWANVRTTFSAKAGMKSVTSTKGNGAAMPRLTSFALAWANASVGVLSGKSLSEAPAKVIAWQAVYAGGRRTARVLLLSYPHALVDIYVHFDFFLADRVEQGLPRCNWHGCTYVHHTTM